MDRHQAKHLQAGLKLGLFYLMPASTRDCHWYRLPCGHLKIIRPYSINKGIRRCDDCEEARLDSIAESKGAVRIGLRRRNGYTFHLCRMPCGHEREVGQERFRSFNPDTCKACTEHKLQVEAAKEGLMIIGKGKTNYYLYHLPCGHSLALQPNKVRQGSRNGGYRCRHCLDERHKFEAKKNGLVMIRNHKDNGFAVYRFERCGHETKRSFQSVREFPARCTTCLHDSFKTDAQAIGLELLGSNKETGRGIYRFNDCGHTQEMEYRHVREGGNECSTCWRSSIVADAKNAGVEYLGQAGPGYGLYRLKCGHERTARLIHVRESKRLLCHECDDTWKTLPSGVYLLQIGSWLKIGRAVDVEKRCGEYGLKEAEIEVLGFIPTHTGEKANEIERRLQRRFRSQRLKPKTMKKLMPASGHTECFSIEAIEQIQEAFYHERQAFRKTLEPHVPTVQFNKL